MRGKKHTLGSEVKKMKHTLRIRISKNPRSESIMRCKNVSVRERLLRFIFGEKHRITVILPGNTVEELTINEIGERSNDGTDYNAN